MPPDQTYAETVSAVQRLRLGVTPAELHGSLTGYLCGGGHAAADRWLDALQLDADTGAAGDATLQRLYRNCAAQFEAARASVAPLLPPRGAALEQRVGALIDWCRGFLGGFGLTGVNQRMDLPTDASDILADFAAIAASRLDFTDQAEDERALADLLDFARNAAALLYREAGAGMPSSARSLH
ncbi:MAG: UPF0149 family protein [Lysobacterales bacterium]